MRRKGITSTEPEPVRQILKRRPFGRSSKEDKAEPITRLLRIDQYAARQGGAGRAHQPSALPAHPRDGRPSRLAELARLGRSRPANLRWTYGRAGRVLISPAYHRIHHAATGRLDINLGTVRALHLDSLNFELKRPSARAL
jgi:hypothetical protein